MAEKRKRVSENRKLAKAVAAVCAAFCLLVMGPVKLDARRDNALDVFYNGARENYTVSVNSDVREAAQYALQLASMAEKIVPGDEAISELTALADKIQSAAEPSEMLAAYGTLSQTATKLYEAMRVKSPDSEIVSDANGKLNAIDNKRVVIEKDPYFALAREFNAARAEFPANVMAGYAGIGELSENR